VVRSSERAEKYLLIPAGLGFMGDPGGPGGLGMLFGALPLTPFAAEVFVTGLWVLLALFVVGVSGVLDLRTDVVLEVLEDLRPAAL